MKKNFVRHFLSDKVVILLNFTFLTICLTLSINDFVVYVIFFKKLIRRKLLLQT